MLAAMRPAALLLLLLSACNDPGRSDDAPACIPGEQQACACPGGGPPGAQICEDSGERFGACFGCGSVDGSSGSPEASTGSEAPDTTGSPAPMTTTTTTGPDAPMEGEPSGPPQAVPPAPPPDASLVVEQTALDRPDLLAASCVETGGNNEFLFEVVRRLRELDDRWGLNWKRGVVGDLSQDVIDYHHGDGVSEGSTEVYIIDIIVGHCGDNPQAGWIDVTQETLDNMTVGMWTLAGQDL